MRHYPPRNPATGNTSWNGTRDRATQARFRKQVLEYAGHQCQGVDSGQRCQITAPLQAHHTQPGNDDPATGVALCKRHHRLVDPCAR